MMVEGHFMRSLWLENQRLTFRDDAPVPVPRAGEALIQVLLAGICSTDLELLRGYYPFTGIPGHEFVGQVVSSPTEPCWVGQRVVGEINIACGYCATCKAGLPHHCENRKALGIHSWDGSFAEYLVLPTDNLHTVPEIIPDEVAVFTEPLAAACEILEQVTIAPSDRVLVIGAGRLGQLIAQVIQTTGCNLQVVARHANQHKLLESRRLRVLSEDSPGEKMYDLVIEATGSVDGFNLAVKTVRPAGKVVLKSTYKGTVEVDISRLVVDEITVIGSRCGPFTAALQLMADRLVDPRPLIESVLSLDQGVSGFELAARTGVLKVLLRP